MKKIMWFTVIILALMAADNSTFPADPFKTEKAEAARYINGYTRSNGTYVSGHWRDTSNDGYSWNNADTLGLND